MRKQSFTVILVLIANFEAIRVRNSSKNKNVLPVKYVVEFNYALIFRSGLKNVVAYIFTQQIWNIYLESFISVMLRAIYRIIFLIYHRCIKYTLYMYIVYIPRECLFLIHICINIPRYLCLCVIYLYLILVWQAGAPVLVHLHTVLFQTQHTCSIQCIQVYSKE